MKFTEERLKLYAAPLSETENEKCKRAIKAIRDALKDLGYSASDDSILPIEEDTYSYSTTLKRGYSSEEIQVFIQGSYANNTCVRGESDVDIAILRKDIHESAFGNRFAPYTPSFGKQVDALILKDSVEKVLRSHFPECVSRRNKSIKVDGNTYRKQADTVPCVHMYYYNKSDDGDYLNHIDGITIFADDGTIINNFPKQHIANGRLKNTITNHYYKKMVRIIKSIRYLMEDLGYPEAEKASSFGLESLLWNIPSDVFKKYSTYKYAFDEVVQYLYQNQSLLPYYKEANGIKPLCPDATAVTDYTSFINRLHVFYEYDI